MREALQHLNLESPARVRAVLRFLAMSALDEAASKEQCIACVTASTWFTQNRKLGPSHPENRRMVRNAFSQLALEALERGAAAASGTGDEASGDPGAAAGGGAQVDGSAEAEQRIGRVLRFVTGLLQQRLVLASTAVSVVLQLLELPQPLSDDSKMAALQAVEVLSRGNPADQHTAKDLLDALQLEMSKCVGL